MSSHLAAQYSQGQLAQALIRQQNLQDFSGAPLPSGASISTQGMVFSQDGSASASTNITGPGRSSNAHSARSAPYPAPSLASQPGVASKNQPPKRRGATDAQINAYLHNDNGSFRTQKEVANALHADGLGADNRRVVAQLKAAGGVTLLPGATDAQINAQLHNDNGSLRIHKEVISALRADGVGADSRRVSAQLQAARGVRKLPGATDAQIDAHLHNEDGSLRTQKEVVSTLHANGVGADKSRIMAQLQAAGGARRMPSATDAQINTYLHNENGSSRTQNEVSSALRADGLGADAKRIWTQQQAARGQQ